MKFLNLIFVTLFLCATACTAAIVPGVAVRPVSLKSPGSTTNTQSSSNTKTSTQSSTNSSSSTLTTTSSTTTVTAAQSPISDAVPVLWFDASIGVTKDGSNLVSSWADMSGSAANATQSTASIQPLYVADAGSALNNKPAVRFDGTNDSLSFALSSTWSGATVILAAKTGSVLGSYGTIISSGNATSGVRWAFTIGSHATQGFGWAGTTANVNLGNGGPIFSTSTSYISSYVYDKKNWLVHSNGTLKYNVTDTSNPTGAWNGNIGAEAGLYYFNGDIAEIAVFNRDLSVSERQKIEGYLSAKYAINVTPSSNQEIWLRADNGLYSDTGCTTPISSSGSSVACWADASGSANHVIQATGGQQPTYLSSSSDFGGKGTLVFNGTALMAKATFANALRDVFAIANRPASNPSGSKMWFDQIPNGSNRFLGNVSATSSVSASHQGNDINLDYNSSLSLNVAAKLLSAFVNPFNMTFGASGLEGLSRPSASIINHGGGAFYVGSYASGTPTYNWDGNISEMIGYSNDMTEFDKQRVETYLSQKYSTSYTTKTVLDYSNITAWYKADSGITTSDFAAQFTAANSESLSIADNAALSTGNIDFSVATWFYLDAIGSATVLMAKGKHESSNAEYALWVDNTVSKVEFAVTNDGINWSRQAWSTTLITGRWYFVVGYHDATNDLLGISVNAGTPQTSAYSAGVTDLAGPFCMGSKGGATCGDSGTNFLGGRMAKAGFWKRILTSAERNGLYNNGKGITYKALTSTLKSGLYAYWNLDEASGTRNDSHGVNHLTDNNTVTQTSGMGSAVGTWGDQSGKGFDATQSTQSSKPQWIYSDSAANNFRPFLRFTAPSVYLNLPSLLTGNTHTVFVVGKQTSAGNEGVVLGDGSGTFNYFGIGAGMGSNVVFYTNGSGEVVLKSVASTTAWMIAGGLHDGTNAYAFQNGVLSSAFATTQPFAPSSIGDYNGVTYDFSGDLAEIILYRKALTTTQRNAVECYLSVKYNIALSGIVCP